MTADALSDVLRTVRLTGAAFFNVVAKAPWVAEQPPREMILPNILPGAGHLIAYHVITEGHCFANIVGGEPVELEAGEIIVFTKGDPHVMSSSPRMRADPVAPSALDAVSGSQLPFLINYGGDGPVSAKLICGWLACDAQPFNPLLNNLPLVIKTGHLEGTDGGWLGQFMQLAMIESSDKRPGGESVLARLSELMFIEVVRRHLETLPPERAGWLAGLRDRFVGKALSLMHGAPARNWTIEELGRAWDYRARCWRSVSPTSSECPRCTISPSGVCKSLPDCSAAAASILRPLPPKPATDRRRPLAALSRRWWA